MTTYNSWFESGYWNQTNTGTLFLSSFPLNTQYTIQKPHKHKIHTYFGISLCLLNVFVKEKQQQQHNILMKWRHFERLNHVLRNHKAHRFLTINHYTYRVQCALGYFTLNQVQVRQRHTYLLKHMQTIWLCTAHNKFALTLWRWYIP